MNHALRTTQRLVMSALLLSTVAMAQAGAKNTNNTKSTEHHSKLSKVAFWRHHNDAKKNAKKDGTPPAASKQSQLKAAQVKPVVDKQTQASKAQVKPISAKQTRKIDQKQNTPKTASPSAKKTTAKASSEQPKKSPQKSTTSENTQDSQKDSSKQ